MGLSEVDLEALKFLGETFGEISDDEDFEWLIPSLKDSILNLVKKAGS